MGLISKIKELFSAQKYIFSAMAEMDRQNAAYAAMSQEELAALSDDELISALLYRTDKALDSMLGKKKKGAPADWSTHLTGAPRIAFILSYFESDVQTYGLEYFFKRNGGLADFVTDCMDVIGASQHKQLCQDLFTAHGCQLGFAEILEYQEELRAFDTAYRALPPLEPILAPYLREHLAEFDVIV